MNNTSKTIRKERVSVIKKKTDSETGDCIIYVNEPNWGIMVSAPTEDEAIERFERAFKATLTVKSFLNLKNSLISVKDSIRTMSSNIKEDLDNYKKSAKNHRNLATQ